MNGRDTPWDVFKAYAFFYICVYFYMAAGILKVRVKLAEFS